MHSARVAELIPVLQIAIGPVILISGVGLLLLSMTNRMSRIIDRSRFIWQELSDLPDGEARDRKIAQLHVLVHRAGLVRLAVGFATLSVMLAAVLIATLFFAALLELEIAWIISLIFMACLFSLMASAGVFLREVQQSLSTLDLEVRLDELPPVSASRHDPAKAPAPR